MADVDPDEEMARLSRIWTAGGADEALAAADAEVEFVDGSFKRIRDLQPGDVLAGGLRPAIDPLERACREICREVGVPEEHWRIFDAGIDANARAVRIAFHDLYLAFRAEYWPPRRRTLVALAVLIVLLGLIST